MRKLILRGLLICLPVLIGVSVQAQNTCFQDWRYTRAISVRNYIFGLLNDWQIKVTIDTQTLIANGQMNADGSDIRFTTNDCCTQLPYWIQSGLNTPNTVIWTRVPQLMSYDTTWVQIYYGNPSANVPMSDIDLVHFSIGNDSMGTDTATPGITVATQEYSFPINARTVRWRIYSADTMRIKFKVSNDTNMVTGSSQFFNVPNTPGFHSFDRELVSVAGGHPGWYTSTGGNFLNTCTPSGPCPGSCGYAVYRTLDQGVFGALKTDTCGVYPSLRVWYRRSAFVDPSTDLWPEFDRQQPFFVSSPGGTMMCPSDTMALFATNVSALSYQWYRNGNMIPGANDTTYLATSNGVYHCVADFGMACHVISSDSITLMYPNNGVDLGPDRLICTNGNDTLYATGAFTSYLWNDNSTADSLVINSSGTFWVIVMDTFGCTNSDTVVVNLRPLPVPVINTVGNPTICRGDVVTLSALNQGWYAYSWIPNGETSADIQATDSGSFAVVVWDSAFCSDTSAFVTIGIHPDPVVDLGPDSEFCEGDSAILDAGAGWASVLWPDNSTNQTLVVNTPGNFVVSVVDTNGCKDSDSILVVRNLNPTVNLGPSQHLCSFDTGTLDAGGGMSAYLWSNGATSPTITAGPGVYSVSVTDNNGCRGVSNVVYFIAYPSLAGVSISGDLNGMVASSSPNYQWYMDSVAIPGAVSEQLVPAETGTYYVVVTDPNGCLDVSSNLIDIVLGITADDIPQGFSPNGDGVNDFFAIKNILQFPNSSLLVMNRYGAKVYSKAPYDNTFNGLENDGGVLPDGTYFYILELGNGQKFGDYLIINR